MDRDEAAEELAKMLFQVGVEGGIESLFDALNNPVGPQRETWSDIKRWYENESEDAKRFIQFIIREATVLAVFGVAVNLDGDSAYRFVDERPADFSVTMRVYRDIDDAGAGVPQEVIEVCPANGGLDVHDLLIDLVDNDNPASG